MSEQSYRILLYYNFVQVEDPEAVRAEQESLCAELGLLGRILIAKEGLNGTVSGTYAATQAYMDRMGRHPLFHATEFKQETHEGHAFLKLHVRVKQEIVNLGIEGLEVPDHAENYIEPDEFREFLRNPDPDTVILDARSDYETSVGKFKGALTLGISNFRDLPEAIDRLEELKGKKILTYCTGGIKCEKVSELLRQKGFDDVRQLHGGIIRYGAEAEGENFEGTCYVFDQRVTTPVNSVNPTVIGECKLCGNATEQIINCANPECNIHFLICPDCALEYQGCCSKACAEHPRRRQWDGRGYYLRGINSKLYARNPDPNYIRLASVQEKNG